MRRLLTMLRSASRTRSQGLLLVLGCFALAALLAAGNILPARTAAAQQPPVPTPQQPVRPPLFGQPDDPNESTDRRMQETLEKGRAEERRKQLVRDTDRLLELAQQLKSQVDKADKNTLSLDVVKKAAEIEKLAKSVKDRMRG